MKNLLYQSGLVKSTRPCWTVADLELLIRSPAQSQLRI